MYVCMYVLSFPKHERVTLKGYNYANRNDQQIFPKTSSREGGAGVEL